MECRTVPVGSMPIDMIVEYTPPSDPLTTLESDTDDVLHYLADKTNNACLSMMSKRVVIPPKSDMSVRVVTDGAGTRLQGVASEQHEKTYSPACHGN